MDELNHKRRDREDSDDGTSETSSEEDRRHKKDKKSKKEHKEHKSKEKKKEKKHKKDKKHKHKDKDKESLLKAAQEFLKKQLGAGAATPAPLPPAPSLLPAAEARQLAPGQRISEDDYFTKSNEFMTWLLEYRQKYFNELSTTDARAIFVEFVADWNSGRLATKYYAGLVLAPAKRTAHAWGFQTTGGAPRGMSAFLDDQKERQGEQREVDRADRRRAAANQREVLEELMPRSTGRDAVVEKKMARKAEAQARDASPDRAFLPGGGDMMGGGDSIASARAWESRREDKFRNINMLKREQLSQRLAAAQAAEDEKMAGLRALLANGPITIAKRT